jgi:hypothetical protein
MDEKLKNGLREIILENFATKQENLHIEKP